MKIGITVDMRHSMFSAGHPNSCIAIAEAFQVGGHDVIFLKRCSDKSWWDDVKSLEADAPKCITIDNTSNLELEVVIDVVIEVAFFLTPQERTRFARCIWYCRKSAIFSDIEATVFECRTECRNIEGLSEIWTADIFNNEDDIVYLKNLYSIPVRVAPWLWSPTIVEAHRKEKQSPVWKQVRDLLPVDLKSKWSLHVAETNTTNTSSSIIPIVTLKEFTKVISTSLEKIHLHNTEQLSDSKYFKENILDNCKVEAKLVGRQRVIDWAHEPLSIVLAHSRFVQLKQANLEAAWVGLPLIHNNTVLRDFGCGLEKTYYAFNNISDAVNRLDNLINYTDTIDYLVSLENLTELRTKILYRFSPEARAKEWLTLLNTKLANPICEIKSEAIIKEDKLYTILFTDMWDQFNPAYNMFIFAFREALPGIEVNGYSLETMPKDQKHSIHIFGPFGSNWKRMDGPKVHYTGENSEPVIDPSVKLNIGFKYIDSPSYFRLPLWMLEINWFGVDANKLAEIKNPLPISLESCTTVSPSKRPKFCAFIVSNSKNTIRNEAFHSLMSYKPVDSAGRLYNNIGDKIFAGLGGGGGELKKHEFLKDYKFCLCYENESSDGYVTEKLLHAKAAGCIPIYWGAPDVSKDFAVEGFINLTGCPEELIEKVKEIDKSDELYEQMASVPAIKPECIIELKEKFTQLVERVLNGYLLVTFATENFWPSLIRWLEAVKLHMTTMRNIKVRVYVGHDITDIMLDKTKEKYTFASFLKIPSKTQTPPDFDDFWEPKHYAWKLWIFKELSEDPRLKGNIILYIDCGSVLIRWPIEWIKEAKENKICFLEDSNQINKSWCNSTFCSRLQVTDEELNSKHLMVGLLCFLGGDSMVKDFFAEAYRLGCIRDVIVGEKWIHNNDGTAHGHRHDQSILSILSYRQNMKRFPLEKVYNHDSARSTYYGGQSIYVHRGNYKSHIPYMPGIDEVYIVNLDRRPDRRISFIESHPYFKGKVKRHVACDGLSLTLTPALASLFKPNDFFWKKAVMGCMISHLKLWTMLNNEPAEIQSYLIMEDDARLKPEWTNAWSKVQDKLPVGWECIYLGGVLPPNKDGFELIKEHVIDGLCRIKPNTFFGQAEPVRQFHFCTYAYILSKAGAKKLLDTIVKNQSIWTSADHVLFNSLDKMNVYCLDPLVAGAFQDDDPAYINSDFNDFSRKDKFDSDLWNNDERFSSDEVAACFSLNLPLTMNISPPLQEIYEPRKKAATRFLSLDICNLTDFTIYEGQWLQELFGQTKFSLEMINLNTQFEPNQDLVLFVQRPQWSKQLEWAKTLVKQGITFKIIHCSDEFTQDPVDIYSLPGVKGVIRFYKRPGYSANTLTIPLGYHWQAQVQSKANSIPLEDRKYTWSFYGTNWKDRALELEPLNEIDQHLVKFFPDWNDPGQLNKEQYIELLQNTIFVPCPEGNNIETYRFYEALESGCIPVFTKLPAVLVDSNIPFLKTETWSQVLDLIKYFLKNPIQLTTYRDTIIESWNAYKTKLKLSLEKWLLL